MKKNWTLIKKTLFTKKEVEHSEKFYKTINFLNKYSFVFHALLACITVFFVELVSRKSMVSTFEFITETPLTYFYNAFLVFTSLTLVYLFRRRAFVRFIVCSFWIVLGITNGIILSNRVTPFVFGDFGCITDLFNMKNANYLSAGLIVLIVLASLLFILACVVFYIKGPVFKGKQYRLVTPLCILATIFIALPVTTKAAQATNVISDYFANIAQGYENYGFIYSFSSGAIDRGMNKPDNYNKEAIDEILTTVNNNKLQTTVNGQTGPNVICVLLESFVDPYEFNFMKYSKDPTPTFHYLRENFTSGYLTVPVIGAGTANSEFEILTGMKLSYFGTGEIPHKTILKKTNCEGIAADLKELGYGTHAVHNNGGNFYSRANAFSMMGFDSFTSKELMNIKEFTPNGGWAEDSILAEETVKTMLATPNQSDFVYTITVGAHGAYPTEPVLEEPYCNVYGPTDPAIINQWTYYMHQLNKTDQFIAELIQEVNKLEEDTIIVLWGDHLPTMGLENEDMVSGDVYKTNYVTWNNFGLEKEDTDLYTYQLMSDVLNDIGVHNGTMVNYHQTQANILDEEAYFNGIELLQYDILYGERYCYNGIDKYPATNIVMDVEDVLLTSVVPDTETATVQIHGNNFTPWSRVYVNGNKVPTTYISENFLTISEDDIENGDTIVVQQMGSNNTVFRASKEWFVTSLKAVPQSYANE